MTSNKFIKLNIQKLLKLIPKLEIYYEYDDFSESHFLKVLPLIQFENNDIYIQFEQKMNNDFFEQYPFELITFLSENDNYEMANAKKFVAPKQSQLQPSISYNNFDFREAIDNLLIDYSVDMPSSINFSAFFNASKFTNTYEEALLHRKKVYNNKASIPVSVAELPTVDISCNGETNITNNDDYSLAA